MAQYVAGLFADRLATQGAVSASRDANYRQAVRDAAVKREGPR